MITEKIGLYALGIIAITLAFVLAVSQIDNGRLERKIAGYEKTIADQKLQAAADSTSITNLKTAISGQNLAIEQWQAVAQRAQLAANDAAGDAMKKARATVAKDRSIAATPKANNAWLQNLFALP